MKLERDDRQIEALACYRRAGDGEAADVVTRARAIAAEAVTLAGSVGMACADLHALVEQAQQAPVREPCDLVGGLGVALLAFCEARGLSADHCERNELARVLSLSPLPVRRQEPRSRSKGGAR